MFAEAVTVILLIGLCSPSAAIHEPKQYVVNLDLPPEQRWLEVLKGEPDILDHLRKIYDDYLPDSLVPLIEKAASALERYMPQPYAGEMKGMADYLNVSVGEIIIPNILYDFSAFCTSIVAEDSSGQIWHGRNLDYGARLHYTGILKNSTIIVHFQKKGKTVYTADTYGGYIGLLTGQKPNAFTFSLDERGDKELYDFFLNVLTALLDPGASLTGFVIRNAFEEANTYSELVDALSVAITVAPSYLIIGGVKPGEGVVVTKNRIGFADIWPLDIKAGRWYLVETNYDHWKPEPDRDHRRRETADAGMNATTQQGLNKKSLFKVLSTPLVLNDGTTFTTIMSAGRPSEFQTWIRD